MKVTHEALSKGLQCEDMKYSIWYFRIDGETFQSIVSKATRFVAKQKFIRVY
jgi:hypothetical protein